MCAYSVQVTPYNSLGTVSCVSTDAVGTVIKEEKYGVKAACMGAGGLLELTFAHPCFTSAQSPNPPLLQPVTKALKTPCRLHRDAPRDNEPVREFREGGRDGVSTGSKVVCAHASRAETQLQFCRLAVWVLQCCSRRFAVCSALRAARALFPNSRSISAAPPDVRASCYKTSRVRTEQNGTQGRKRSET